LVNNSMQLLNVARQGMTEPELLSLLGNNNEPLPHAVWSPLYLAIKTILMQRSGMITFFHPALKKAVDRRYLSDSQKKYHAHRKLVHDPFLKFG